MEAFLGTIMPWPISWAPQGWAFCVGQEMNISQNAALYSLLGTYYGGNGKTTFKLPDLRGRMIVGAGQRIGSNYQYNLAQAGGNDTINITPSTIPQHSHSLSGTVPVSVDNIKVEQPVSTTPGTVANPQGAYPASARVADVYDVVNNYNSTATSGAYLAPITVSGTGVGSLSGSTGTTGAGEALYSMSPFIVMNYIIAIEGIYPSRQ